MWKVNHTTEYCKVPSDCSFRCCTFWSCSPSHLRVSTYTTPASKVWKANRFIAFCYSENMMRFHDDTYRLICEATRCHLLYVVGSSISSWDSNNNCCSGTGQPRSPAQCCSRVCAQRHVVAVYEGPQDRFVPQEESGAGL
jgi:hypothetical protein